VGEFDVSIGALEAPHELTPLNEIWLHSEMVYHIAFRIWSILEPGLLPFGKRFKALGVRDVRNKLVGHPEKHDGVVARTFLIAWDGPQIKAVRAEGASRRYMDKGLYTNLREFFAAFEAMLAKAEHAHPGEPADSAT